jgi:hypothetical protein
MATDDSVNQPAAQTRIDEIMHPILMVGFRSPYPHYRFPYPIAHSSLVKSDIFEISHYIPMFSSYIPMNPPWNPIDLHDFFGHPHIHSQAARPMNLDVWPPHIQAGDCFVQCAHCAEKGGSTSDQAPPPRSVGGLDPGTKWKHVVGTCRDLSENRLPHSIHWSRILTNKKMQCWISTSFRCMCHIFEWEIWGAYTWKLEYIGAELGCISASWNIVGTCWDMVILLN